MKFLVTVYASQPVYCEVEVEAASKEEAKTKALEEVSDDVAAQDWCESDSPVDVDDATAYPEEVRPRHHLITLDRDRGEGFEVCDHCDTRWPCAEAGT